MNNTHTSVLIIGYGNDLRGDDGIGPQVAQIVAGWRLPQVRSLPLHQLTPELASDIAGVSLVIFVDAGSGIKHKTESIKLYPHNSKEYREIRSHWSDPNALLSLTHALYDSCPEAWNIIVPGVNFELGDRLSSVAQQGITQALTQIKYLIGNSKLKTTPKRHKIYA